MTFRIHHLTSLLRLALSALGCMLLGGGAAYLSAPGTLVATAPRARAVSSSIEHRPSGRETVALEQSSSSAPSTAAQDRYPISGSFHSPDSSVTAPVAVPPSKHIIAANRPVSATPASASFYSPTGGGPLSASTTSLQASSSPGFFSAPKKSVSAPSKSIAATSNPSAAAAADPAVAKPAATPTLGTTVHQAGPALPVRKFGATLAERVADAQSISRQQIDAMMGRPVLYPIGDLNITPLANAKEPARAQR